MPQVKRLKEVIECHETQKKSKTEDSKSQSRYVLLSTYLDLDEFSATILLSNTIIEMQLGDLIGSI